MVRLGLEPSSIIPVMPLGTADTLEHQRQSIPNTPPAFGGSPYTSPYQAPASGQPNYAIPGGNMTQFQGQWNTGDPLTALLRSQLSDNTMQGTDASRRLTQDTGLANALYGNQADYLNDQYGFDVGYMNNDYYRQVTLGKLGNDQDLAWRLANNALTLGDAARLDKLAGRQYNLNMDTADAGLARTNQGATNDYNRLVKGLGLASDVYDLGRDKNKSAFGASSRRAISDATRTGSSLSSGYRDVRHELADQLNQSDRGTELQFKGERNAFDAGIDTMNLNRQTGVDKYNTDTGQAGINLDRSLGEQQQTRDRAKLDADKARADHDLQDKMLGSVAKDFGIKADDLKSTLSNGIDRLGIDLQQTLSGLAADFASDSAQRRANANAIMAQLIQVGQLNAVKPAATPAPQPTGSSTAAGQVPGTSLGGLLPKPISLEPPGETWGRMMQGASSVTPSSILTQINSSVYQPEGGIRTGGGGVGGALGYIDDKLHSIPGL